MSYISKITLPDGSSYDLKDNLNNLYAVCSSTGASAYKDITLPSAFNWQEGITIHVLFTNANSNSAPSLRINNTTSALIDISNGSWNANELVSLTYTGSVWKISGTLGILSVSRGGTGATTAAAAKVNLNINVAGQDISFWNPNGQTQQWAFGSWVLPSETSGVTKTSEGHRTSLVIRDDGINVWDSTTNSTTWNINVNTGTNYGIFYRNGINATVATNLYFVDNGYTLDNKNSNGGTDIGYRATGSAHSVFFGIGAGNVNRGISDTALGGWAFMLDSSNNVTINASSAITLGKGTSVSGYLQTTANMFAGWTTNTTSVYNGARGQGGQIAFWIDNTSTTGTKGIWAKNASGTEISVLEVNQSGVVTLNGRANAIRDNASTGRWIYADYANTVAASDWACMWVNPSGTTSVTIGAVSVVSMINKAIIYSSTQPAVVNGKIWLKPV